MGSNHEITPRRPASMAAYGLLSYSLDISTISSEIANLASKPTRRALSFTRVIVNGLMTPINDLLDEVSDRASPIVALLAQRATIAIDRAELLSPAVNDFSVAIQRCFGVPAYTNVYITPVFASGAACHADNHDVVAVQLLGAKTWRIYEKECDNALPLIRQELRVAPNEFVALPRGVLHSTCNNENSLSVHLSVNCGCAIDAAHDFVGRFADLRLAN